MVYNVKTTTTTTTGTSRSDALKRQTSNLLLLLVLSVRLYTAVHGTAAAVVFEAVVVMMCRPKSGTYAIYPEHALRDTACSRPTYCTAAEEKGGLSFFKVC